MGKSHGKLDSRPSQDKDQCMTHWKRPQGRVIKSNLQVLDQYI